MGPTEPTPTARSPTEPLPEDTSPTASLPTVPTPLPPLPPSPTKRNPSIPPSHLMEPKGCVSPNRLLFPCCVACQRSSRQVLGVLSTDGRGTVCAFPLFRRLMFPWRALTD